MKTIIFYCLTGFMIFIPDIISGQNVPADIPFNIDIKKNFGNIKTVNLSDIGKELQYIPLETKPECMIERIGQIEFSDSYIFVSESNRLLQFDKNGKFIRQIGSEGRGPGEYIIITDFCIDNEKEEIYIPNFGIMLVFSFDGHFKRSINISFRPVLIINKDPNSLMYYLVNTPGQSVKQLTDPVFSWIITDKEGAILGSIRNNLRRVNRPGIMSLLISIQPLYMYNKTAHFMEFGIDTLYYFQGALKKPYAIISLGNMKMDPDPPFNTTDDKLWVNIINENDEYLFVELNRGLTDFGLYPSYIYTTFNKKTAEVTILNDNGFRNDIDGGMPFWPKFIFNDNIMVDHIDAFNLLNNIKEMQSVQLKEKGKVISTQLSDLGKQLTEFSNPVLIILK